jgi:ribosomal protein S18 acetylase RimI-like enzyme
MAALSEVRLPEVLDLRKVRVEDLDGILQREMLDWRRQLDWDFQQSADLVRRFVAMRALNGYALIDNGKPVGYSYFVCEERKGLIGDLYLMEENHTIENENRLLAAVLENLTRTPYLERVESQLMMLRPVVGRPLPGSEFLTIHQRNFMVIDASRVVGLRPGAARSRVLLEKWREQRHEAAAQLIAAAYRGHIDSSINDQYRSVPGARRFLTNIVQYPGCGAFFQPASYLAFEPATGRLCGMSLTSLLASDVGHITQICVAPSAKRTGVGYELLRRSLESLAQAGCRKMSLTVTADNAEAVRLYQRVGFNTARTFAAMVWEGF